MSNARQYIFIHWYDTGEIIEAGTVAAAKAMVRDRYPNAHFDDWLITYPLTDQTLSGFQAAPGELITQSESTR